MTRLLFFLSTSLPIIMIIFFQNAVVSHVSAGLYLELSFISIARCILYVPFKRTSF